VTDEYRPTTEPIRLKPVTQPSKTADSKDWQNRYAHWFDLNFAIKIRKFCSQKCLEFGSDNFEKEKNCLSSCGEKYQESFGILSKEKSIYKKNMDELHFFGETAPTLKRYN